MSKIRRTTVLIILDGFGHRIETNNNAIKLAFTPNFDRLWKDSTHCLISGSGLDVGLPDGQMGNSEVGHMSLGSGRIVDQTITRIDKAISEGDFFCNEAYLGSIDSAVKSGGSVHVLGLLSPGGVHSHENHIFECLNLAASRGGKKLYLHAFLDGRDTPPKSALASIERTENVFQALGTGKIASIHGRYWAMDRNNNWDRIKKTHDLLINGACDYRYETATEALNQAYNRGEHDEFIIPTGVGQAVEIGNNDAVLFMNFRADRARQLTQALTEKSFEGFERRKNPRLFFTSTASYGAMFEYPIAFPPEKIEDSLGEILSKKNLSQLRVAETEKYAHVTFFFSGGREKLFDGEERCLIPSPDVPTYDLKPEMSAHEVTDSVVSAIESGTHDFIVVNYANGDMVGHTGNCSAAIKAVETLDLCLGRLENALVSTRGQGLITADHGNCEQMHDDKSGQPHTQHTTEKVPLIYIGTQNHKLDKAGGILADIAPTVLAIMGIEIPSAMSGRSLIDTKSFR